MARKSHHPFSSDELQAAFSGDKYDRYPAVMSPKQLADLLNLSAKTIYEWLAKGRLRGAARKRGKHILIWRDRALDILFNGSDWNDKA